MKQLLIYLLMPVICVIGCTKSNTMEWDQASRVRAYAQAIVDANSDIVDHLDVVFHLSEHRDSILNGHNHKVVIDRYFTNNPFFNGNNLNYNSAEDTYTFPLGGDGTSGCLEISHNNKSLCEYGSEWRVVGRRNRVWSLPEEVVQPDYVDFTLTVINYGEYCTVKGTLITNHVNEYYFTSIDVDYRFQFSPIVIVDNESVFGRVDYRPMNQYRFNGNLGIAKDGLIDPDKCPRPVLTSAVTGLTGYNPKEYYQGIPIYSGCYFSEGEINACENKGNSIKDFIFTINDTSWHIIYDGNDYHIK